MSEKFKAGPERVQQFLNDKGSKAIVEVLPEITATAEDAAKALNVPVSHIGKSIVFDCDSNPVVVVLSGIHRVNKELLAKAINSKSAKSLSAIAVKEMTGFPIGGVSPFALPNNSILVLDLGLKMYDHFFVAAGHPKAIVKMTFDELVSLTDCIVEDIVTK